MNRTLAIGAVTCSRNVFPTARLTTAMYQSGTATARMSIATAPARISPVSA